MKFDDIVNKTSPQLRDLLAAQALKRQEYNRQYQARLRQAAKLLTLEKKIDNNLDYVLGYIKSRYSREYAAWVAPAEPAAPVVRSNSFFDNWILLSAHEYKSIADAFEVSGLSKHMSLAEFTPLFNHYYQQNNSGQYIKS